jgi:hypothetical protein
MKVLKASKELTKIEQYMLTVDKGAESMKDVPDGASIPVSVWCTYEDEKEDGTLTEITSIMDTSGKVYAFQSATFRKSLEKIHEVFGGEPYAIIKESGKTKAGRDFIDCRLDYNSVQH